MYTDKWHLHFHYFSLWTVFIVLQNNTKAYLVYNKVILPLFSAIVITCLIWLLYIIDKLYGLGSGIKVIGPSDIRSIYDLKVVGFYINLVKSVLYLISGLITIRERNELLKEMKASPLLRIDESLSAEIYQNILMQSKNPDDPELAHEYRRLTLLNKDAKSLGKMTNESNGESFTKLAASINNGTESLGGVASVKSK